MSPTLSFSFILEYLYTSKVVWLVQSRERTMDCAYHRLLSLRFRHDGYIVSIFLFPPSYQWLTLPPQFTYSAVSRGCLYLRCLRNRCRNGQFAIQFDDN